MLAVSAPCRQNGSQEGGKGKYSASAGSHRQAPEKRYFKVVQIIGKTAGI
jgi:hypothetical protein